MRVAVVNAMTTAWAAWTHIIRQSEYQLAWCAANGPEAVNLSAIDPPDVIVMDPVIQQIHGAETIRLIMQRSPCPILIATASIERYSDIVFQALGAGAMDAVSIPDDMETAAKAVLKKVALLGQLSKPAIKLQTTCCSASGRFASHGHSEHLVVIGCSSGGPTALARILARLPATYHSPIVVLQHIDSQFALHLATWLDQKTAMKVKIARKGDNLEAGQVYIAASGNHLLMNEEYKLYYNAKPIETYYRPSLDIFFQSVAEHWPNPLTAILLTGMGQDGAHGLLQLRGVGAYTIAQDEQSSAVYGMPKAAAHLGAAVDILPLDGISDVLRDSAFETAKQCKNRCS